MVSRCAGPRISTRDGRDVGMVCLVDRIRTNQRNQRGQKDRRNQMNKSDERDWCGARLVGLARGFRP